MINSWELERVSPNLFSLHFHYPSLNESLIQYMKKELGNTLVTKDSITFQSTNAYIVNKNRRKRGEYREALWMMHSLSKQILFLKEERKKRFASMNIGSENILCIEDRGLYFYLYSEEELNHLEEEESDIFSSLGYMIIDFLNGNREKRVEGGVAIPIPLGPIHGTKLYWFILRAIDPNPANRTFLFI